MAIGLNSLLLENTNLVSIMDKTPINEECYLYNTVKFLREMNEDFRECNREFYRSVYEADSLVAFNESFGDFFEKMKDIIAKFLKYIKSLVERFITALHRIVGSEKYLIKKEDQLKKFNSNCEFDFEGYNFTISPNIPVCNALVAFNDKFVELDFNQLKDRSKTHAKKKEIIKTAYDNLNTAIDNDKYDKFRQEVIEAPQPIYQSEFGNELFKVFRDDYDNTSTFTVTSSVVTQSLNSLKNYKSSEKDVTDKKKDIENQYKAISKQIDKLITSNRSSQYYNVDINTEFGGGTVNLDNSAMNQLNLYIKALMTQITEMSTIHSMAFSYKLDALKDKYNQDKRILYIALSKVEKDKDIRRGDA